MDSPLRLDSQGAIDTQATFIYTAIYTALRPTKLWYAGRQDIWRDQRRKSQLSRLLAITVNGAMMDELDRMLLGVLQTQGYQKSTALAGRLGLGERTIRRRISDMRSKGIIKIIAVPDPVLFGYRGWAKIGIKVEPKSLSDVACELVKHPSVYFVAQSLGTWDIMIAVHFDTIDRLTHFASSELTKVGGVLRTETVMLTWPRKYYNFSWPAPSPGEDHTWKRNCDVTTDRNVYAIDETEREIIDVLMGDGLAPPAALKSRLGIGEGTIRKRIKKMLKDGVFKIEVVPNPDSMEYDVWATMGIIIANESAHKVINDIIKNPGVYLASVSIGRFNIIISARFRDIDSLTQFANNELAQIKGVSAVDTFLHTRLLKYHNINWLRPAM